MFRVTCKALLVVLTLASITNSANSAARNFFSPSLLGDRIAFCTSTSELCGKPIADAWCTYNGFEKAILFQRHKNSKQTAASFIRYIDSGKVCSKENCISFAQIKCYSPG